MIGNVNGKSKISLEGHRRNGEFPMFSQTLEYALRAMVALAQEPERPLTTAQITEYTRVPAGYLSKVLQTLVKTGLIKATRGLHGGYELLRPVADITILEIVSAVDPIKRIRTCPLDIPEHGQKLCLLHRKMDDALAEVERAFDACTLADLVVKPAVDERGIPVHTIPLVPR